MLTHGDKPYHAGRPSRRHKSYAAGRSVALQEAADKLLSLLFAEQVSEPGHLPREEHRVTFHIAGTDLSYQVACRDCRWCASAPDHRGRDRGRGRASGGSAVSAAQHRRPVTGSGSLQLDFSRVVDEVVDRVLAGLADEVWQATLASAIADHLERRGVGVVPPLPEHLVQPEPARDPALPEPMPPRGTVGYEKRDRCGSGTAAGCELGDPAAPRRRVTCCH